MRRSRRSTETPSALVLLASQGLGGGIEALADTVIDALRTLGVKVEVLALLSAERPVMSAWGKVRFSIRALWRARLGGTGSRRVIVMHPSLAWIAVLADIVERGSQPHPTLFFYDLADIRCVPRLLLGLVRWRALKLVTISRFSAGALAGSGAGRARILSPALSTARYASFSGVQRLRRAADLRAPELLTVCRLDQSVGKGIPVLIDAAERLIPTDPTLSLVVAGRGPAPPALLALADSRPWIRLVESPSTHDLAQLYRKASIFALATRTQSCRGTYPTGEGFGLVLAEAQLSGLPVVAPASGGCADAFLEGITGVRPSDESAAALEAAVRALLDDPIAYRRMSASAAAWATQAFCPEQTVRAVRAALLGAPSPTLHRLLLTDELGRQDDGVDLDGSAGAIPSITGVDVE